MGKLIGVIATLGICVLANAQTPTPKETLVKQALVIKQKIAAIDAKATVRLQKQGKKVIRRIYNLSKTNETKKRTLQGQLRTLDKKIAAAK